MLTTQLSATSLGQDRRPRPSLNKDVKKTMTELADIKKANGLEGFTGSDFDYLAHNEYARYAPNSKRIGHAVITHDEHNNLIAQQYELPTGIEKKTPTLTRLTKIESLQRNGEMHYQAIGLDGKKYYSRRSMKALINKKDSVEIAYFSEEEDPENEPEWGNNHVPPLFREDVRPPEMPQKTKGGHTLQVDYESVRHRDTHHNREIDQNTVMGMAAESKQSEATKLKKASQSAQQAYKEFDEERKSELTPEMRTRLQRAYNADIQLAPENQYRPEWLHAYAYSLTPTDIDPQIANNLGAGSKWMNTTMMGPERTAKWFAINQPHILVSILSAFEMVRDTEIIGSLHYELSLELLDRSLQFVLDIPAFIETPVFPKASDLAQGTGVAYAILQGHIPSSPIETITTGPTQEASNARKKENSSIEEAYTSIEETIQQTLADKLAGDNTAEPPQKKLKRDKNTTQRRFGNTFFAPPEQIAPNYSIATIVDFETTGLNPTKHDIIEIGMISFSFSTTQGVWEVVGHYHSLNDPHCPIPPAITKITKIDDSMVAGQAINWDLVLQFLQRSNFMICHNSKFDRKFFELRAREDVQAMVRTKPFGCTYKDIDWDKRGFESKKLTFLNQQMGFPFIGHRAINDCWATLNLLVQDPSALNELVINIKKETMIGVINAPIKKKELLKEWGYQWSNGNHTRLPQGWWVSVPNEYVDAEKTWLNQVILNDSAQKSKKGHIEEHDAALDRYAPRMLK